VPERPGELRLEVGSPIERGLPALGGGLASHGGTLSQREAELLRALHFDHVRVDLHLKDPAYRKELQRGTETCRAIGAGFELALFLSSNAEAELGQLAEIVPATRVPVKQVLVLEEAEGFSTFRTMTPAPLLRLARERLQGAMPQALFAGGTDQFFTELNRDWSQVDPVDGIVYSLNPQVHACDDSSVMENLQGQVDTVSSTRQLSGGKPVFVSPVTFIGRSGPFPAGPPEPDGLPPTVEVRQAALFGAAWTVGSIKALSEAGAASVTYFETTGWQGIVETDEGPPMPERFPSRPGSVFPLYHVFADLAEWKQVGGVRELVEARSNDPLAVTALAMRANSRLHLLVANLTWRSQTAQVGPLDGSQVQMRRLDEETAPLAMSDPERFRSSFESHPVQEGVLRLDLLPYAVIRVDIGQESA
jgi:hypothetical protein